MKREIQRRIDNFDVSGVVRSVQVTGGATSSLNLNDFLRRDGLVPLEGNLAVVDGVTVDGVDISALKVSYDAHSSDPDAHHVRAVSGSGTTVDSSTQVVDVRLSSLKGLNFDVAGALQVALGAAGGLGFDASGNVKVSLNTNPGLALSSGGLSILLNTNSGMTVGAGGLSVQLATNPGLTVGAGGVAVLLNTNSGLALGAGGLSVQLATNPGLTVGAGGVAMGTPSQLSAVTTNSVTGGNHTHAILAYSDASANPANIIKSDGSGGIVVDTLQAATHVRAPLLNTATGNMSVSPASDLILSPGSNLVKLATGKGIQTTSFTSGFAGAGARLDDGITISGKTALEVDEVTVRGRMRVYELLINQIRATNGNWIFSGSGKVETVTGTGPYVISTGSNTNHGFAVGDLIRAQRFTGTGIYQSNMQVTVVSSTTQFTATLTSGDAPARGMEYVRIGSATDANRRGVVYVASEDTGSPFVDVVDGIAAHSDWNTVGKVKARIGKLSGIFATTNEYGIAASNTGWGTNDSWMRVSNVGAEMHNIPIKLYSAGTQKVNIDANGTDIWVGVDSAQKKLSWNGSTLTVVGNITVLAGSSGLAQFSDANLDSITDGTNYARILKTDISAGHIKLDSAIDGTYGKVASTDIQAGHIKLDTTVDGTYGKIKSTIIGAGFIKVGSGIKDGSLSGWQIDDTEIVGQTSGVDQVVLGTNGKVLAGAGAVVLSQYGLDLQRYDVVAGGGNPNPTNNINSIAWWTNPATINGASTPVARIWGATNTGGVSGLQFEVNPASANGPRFWIEGDAGGAPNYATSMWLSNIDAVYGIPGFSAVRDGSGTTVTISNKFRVGDHALPTTSNAYDLGASGTIWRKLYVDEVVANTITGSTSLTGQFWQYDTGDMYVRSNSSSLRTLYIANPGTGSMNLDVEGSISLGGTIDGIDLSAFKATYDAHTVNANAHHAQSHALATTGGLGTDHSVSGLTSGQVLKATSATAAAFVQLQHSEIGGLTTGDPHTQYVHLSNARTLTAQHTFAPATATAPFLLGTNAQGQLVTGLNADLLDGYESSIFPRKAENATITGQYTFSPASTQAPFILSANAQGQLVTGLNADLLDGYESSIFPRKAENATITGQYTFSPASAQAPFALSTNAQGQLVTGLRADQLSKSISVSGLGLSGGGAMTADRTITLASSSSPGAVASILASNASGGVTLVTVDATTDVTTPVLTSSAALAISAASGNISLDASTELISIGASNALQSANYASQTTGWGISYAGGADFRYLFSDELHAKSFIADLEQALAGGQIIAKSVAILYSTFTAPAAGASTTLTVRDLPSATGMAVFQNGDFVRIRNFTRASGSLTISDCWGTVVLDTTYGTSGFDSSTKTQRYTFTRSSGTIGANNAPGGMAATTTVAADALILDYGVSGNGFYEVNAIDGAYATNSPYAQIVSWTTHPNTGEVVRARLGNLKGIFAAGNEYGLYAGTGTATTDQYLRISNVGSTQNNIASEWRESGTTFLSADATDGIDIVVGSSYINKRAYTFSQAGTIFGGLYGYYNSGATEDVLAVRTNRLTTNSSIYIDASTTTPYNGYISLSASGLDSQSATLVLKTSTLGGNHGEIVATADAIILSAATTTVTGAINANSAEINGNVVVDSTNAKLTLTDGSGDLNLAQSYQNLADANSSEIANDITTYDALMIAGNKAGDGTNKCVNIYDQLFVSQIIEVEQGRSTGNKSVFTGRYGTSSGISLTATSWGYASGVLFNAYHADTSISMLASGACKYLGAQYTGNVSRPGLLNWDANGGLFTLAYGEAGLANEANITSWTKILEAATTGLKVIGNVGFNNTAPISKPSVTGSRGGNAALASLLTALANYGLITNSSTA